MGKKQSFKSFLSEPPGWFIAIWILLTLIFVAGALVCVALNGRADSPQLIIGYVFYTLSAITFSYSVYLMIKLIPKIKHGVTRLLQKNKFTNRILEQYGFRTVIFSIGSFIISFVYVIFNTTLAVLESSIWYGSLAAYYFMLLVMRSVVLNFHKQKKKRQEMEECEIIEKRIKIYRGCGVGLVVLPMCLSSTILQMVRGFNSFEHAGLTIYVAAIYAFYKIVMSIINIFKARQSDDMTVRAIRCVNLADAMVSILALQTAMIKEFGDSSAGTAANVATGATVCVLTLALGVFMIVASNKKLKALKEENAHES